MNRPGFLAAILALSTLFLGTPLQAQEEVTETTTVEVPIQVDKGPEDALNRGTPRGSVVGFLDASSKFEFEKAAGIPGPAQYSRGSQGVWRSGIGQAVEPCAVTLSVAGRLHRQ